MFFADDFFRCEVPHAQQLCQVYEQTGCSVLSLVKVADDGTKRYGIADIGEKLNDKIFKIKQLVEKPGPKKAPSHFATVGGYLLTPDILPYVEKLKPGIGGEIVLLDPLICWLIMAASTVNLLMAFIMMPAIKSVICRRWSTTLWLTVLGAEV